MSTASKLWLGFGLLLLFLVAIGLFVTYRLGVTERALQTVSSVQEPAAALAYDLALNVSTSDAEVLAHVTAGGSEHRARATKSRSEFDALLDRYRRSSQISPALAGSIRAEHAGVRALGDSLMTLSDDLRASATRFERRAEALRMRVVGELGSRVDLSVRNRDTQRKLGEVTRLEADLNGISAALGLYLLNRQPAMRERIEVLAADLRETLARYGQLRHSDAEQRDLAHISTETPPLLGLARETMDRADRVESVRTRFIIRSDELEQDMDEGLHRLARIDLMKAQTDARRSLGDSRVAVAVLLIVGLLIGIVTALPMGFGIVRAENTLREAHRHKDEFLDLLGHELRNPLAVLANSLALVEARSAALPDDLRRSHGMIRRQIRNMTRIVDDLLDVSRINRGKIVLRREPLPLGALVTQCVDDLRPLAQERRHRLALALPDEPPWVSADPVRLSQMITNLIHNAVKYTPPGGRIDVAVRSDGDAVVEVRDSGVGIPATMLDRIFEPFTQLDASLRQSHGGLGIGLSLVDRLARLHGGTVTAASPGEGRGSTFTLRLPREEAPEPRTVPAAKFVAGRPQRVLVVDDNRDSAESMAGLLRIWGHEVHVAFDGPDAIAQAERLHPEFVLLDIGLPGMDGYQVADRLRKESGMDSLTLVAMTGYGQQADRERAYAAGFDHHLTKPVDVEELQSLLRGPLLRDAVS